MYTLRIIEETRENEDSSFEQVIENFELGRAYCKIKKGHSSEFKRIMDNMYPEENDKDIKALVIGENEQIFFFNGEYDK